MANDNDRQRLVEEAVQELLDPWSELRGVPRLDVSKPNFHDSKAEFRRELEAVEKAIESLQAASRAIFPWDEDSKEESAELARSLGNAIDQNAGRRIRVTAPSTIIDLVRKNKADTGYYYHAIWSLLDLIEILRNRHDELKDQERQYWSKPHRAPNYYARAIALRLARLYAQEKGERPTFGTARDGGHPSTSFGRALEKIFAALEIKGGVKRPAKWAIEQLSEQDLQQRRPTGLLGAVLGGRAADETASDRARSENTIANYLRALAAAGSTPRKGAKE